LLIADEPTTALDVTVQAEILDLLRDLHNRLDSAIILITHDMGVVADLADHIVVMRRGEIVEAGTSAKIFGSPEHPYTQQLLAAVPHLGTSAERVLEPAKVGEAPVLSLSHVTIDYPKRGRVPAFRAVEDVSLEIRPGELVGLVGESGSGKTTIGRAAMGLIPIADGELRVVGQDIRALKHKELRNLRRQTGIVFQDPSSSLNPRLPVGQSIGEPILLAGIAKGAKLDSMVKDLLDQVELPTMFRNRYPHELSGGQKQRIGIARALALNPKLLVADEPTSALDVSVQSRFLELLLELQQKSQFACLFISHDLAVVDLLAHRIVVLRNGKTVEQGDRDSILRDAKDPYTQRLIAAVPLPDPEAQRINREKRLAGLR
jgi:peptide/nickel transport system ATP-binding protein